MKTLSLLLFLDGASGAAPPWGWIGGLLGATIGLLGGAYGTWNSLRRSRPGPERDFLKRVALGAWAVVLLFLAGLFFVPAPWSLLLWPVYGVGLFVGIARVNRIHARIHAEEAAADPGPG